MQVCTAGRLQIPLTTPSRRPRPHSRGARYCATVILLTCKTGAAARVGRERKPVRKRSRAAANNTGTNSARRRNQAAQLSSARLGLAWLPLGPSRWPSRLKFSSFGRRVLFAFVVCSCSPAPPPSSGRTARVSPGLPGAAREQSGTSSGRPGGSSGSWAGRIASSRDADECWRPNGGSLSSRGSRCGRRLERVAARPLALAAACYHNHHLNTRPLRPPGLRLFVARRRRPGQPADQMGRPLPHGRAGRRISGAPGRRPGCTCCACSCTPPAFNLTLEPISSRSIELEEA